MIGEYCPYLSRRKGKGHRATEKKHCRMGEGDICEQFCYQQIEKPKPRRTIKRQEASTSAPPQRRQPRQAPPQRKGKRVVCYNCKKEGHLARDCKGKEVRAVSKETEPPSRSEAEECNCDEGACLCYDPDSEEEGVVAMASSRSPREVTRTPIDPRHFISMKDVEQISQTQLTYSQPFSKGELEVGSGSNFNCFHEALVPVQRREKTWRKVFAVDGGMTNANSRARNVKVHLTEEIREKFHFMIFLDMQYDVLLGLPFFRRIKELKIQEDGISGCLSKRYFHLLFCRPPGEESFSPAMKDNREIHTEIRFGSFSPINIKYNPVSGNVTKMVKVPSSAWYSPHLEPEGLQ
ncbi:hypothetical protein FRX31_035323, partial [Thalictrum thalictroides]